jgi:hypothetical protein
MIYSYKFGAVFLLLATSYLCIVVASSDERQSNSNANIATDPASLQRYLATYDMESLHKALDQRFHESERMMDPSKRITPLPPNKAQRGAGFDVTTRYKIEADLEQAQYLAEHLPANSLHQKLFQDKVVPVYEKVLKEVLPSEEDLRKNEGVYRFTLLDQLTTGIKDYYNRAVYRPEDDEEKTTSTDDESCPSNILNPDLDWKAIEQEYWSQDPQVVVIDNVLSKEALDRIRKILLQSTVFYQTKKPDTFGGYTGAYIDDGLHDRILLELAMDLRRRMPSVLDSHALRYLWAYKYDSKYQGIKLHADQAAVNVNIWITPDEANLDPNSGGLVVFTVKPPADWDIMKYNSDTEKVYEELLKPAGFRNVTIPYRENRAVLFDSALFHQTDKFHFKPGYPNRRINLTILYGEMQPSSSSSN